ncbi:MAG: hypothetical protein DRI44_06125 [Chlamydiae bacterium]|nr:MAG: hypothetical protein DRI44_06125 [Chlamydiota bacterium]
MWKMISMINVLLSVGIDISDYLFCLYLSEIGIWIYGVMIILICLYINKEEITELVKKVKQNGSNTG